MKKHLIAALIVMAVSTGCYRVPKLENSNIEVSRNIKVSETQERELEFNNNNWWTIYGDENLNSLVEIVIESNIDLDIAQLNIRKANEGVSRVKGAKLPSAAVSGAALRTRVPDSNTELLDGSKADIYNIGLSVNYDLDLFNKLSSLEKSQEFLVKGRELQRDFVTLNVTTMTTEVYGYYIYLDKINKNLSEKLDILTELREMTVKGVRAGQNVDNDILRIDNEINDIKGSIEENTLTQRSTLESLNLLAGYKKTDDIKKILADAGENSKVLDKELVLPNEIASTVVSNRPDVKYYLMIIESQKYKLKSIEADYYPQFSIIGSLNETKIDFRNGFTPSALAWSLGPKIYLPIFNMSQIDAEYKVAGLDLETFIKDYDKTLMTSFKNINVELAANKTSKDTLILKEENLRNSDKILKDSELELYLGSISRYELLLKRYDNLEIGLDREVSRYSSYKEQVSLINSLGGVYQDPDLSKENTDDKKVEA